MEAGPKPAVCPSWFNFEPHPYNCWSTRRRVVVKAPWPCFPQPRQIVCWSYLRELSHFCGFSLGSLNISSSQPKMGGTADSRQIHPPHTRTEGPLGGSPFFHWNPPQHCPQQKFQIYWWVSIETIATFGEPGLLWGN